MVVGMAEGGLRIRVWMCAFFVLIVLFFCLFLSFWGDKTVLVWR